MISNQLLATAFTYTEYKKLLEDLLAQGKTTVGNQSEEYLNYAGINLQRMKRLEKTIVLSEEIQQQLTKIQSVYYWFVITEGWCGDAAQNIPLLEFIARACPNINLKLILRDEHPEIMDQYLTKGSRSIPILICLEGKSMNELFVWGPRPKELQDQVLTILARGGSKEEKGLMVQKWYNADKTLSQQKELFQLLKKLT